MLSSCCQLNPLISLCSLFQSHYYFSKFSVQICCHCCLHVYNLFLIETMPWNGRCRRRPKRIRSSGSVTAAAECTTTKHQKSRKQWSEQSLLAAQEAVQQLGNECEWSCSCAWSSYHDKPYIIMIDTQSGRVKHVTKHGLIPYQLLWLPGSTGWVTVIVHLLWMWMFRVVWRQCQCYMDVEKNGLNVVVTDDGSMRNALHALKWAQMDFVHTVCCSFIIHYSANFVLILIFRPCF